VSPVCGRGDRRINETPPNTLGPVLFSQALAKEEPCWPANEGSGGSAFNDVGDAGGGCRKLAVSEGRWWAQRHVAIYRTAKPGFATPSRTNRSVLRALPFDLPFRYPPPRDRRPDQRAAGMNSLPRGWRNGGSPYGSACSDPFHDDVPRRPGLALLCPCPPMAPKGILKTGHTPSPDCLSATARSHLQADAAQHLKSGRSDPNGTSLAPAATGPRHASVERGTTGLTVKPSRDRRTAVASSVRRLRISTPSSRADMRGIGPPPGGAWLLLHCCASPSQHVEQSASTHVVRPRRNPLGHSELYGVPSQLSVAQTPNLQPRTGGPVIPPRPAFTSCGGENLLQPDPPLPTTSQPPTPATPATTAARPSHCRHHLPQATTAQQQQAALAARLNGRTYGPMPGGFHHLAAPGSSQVASRAHNRAQQLVSGGELLGQEDQHHGGRRLEDLGAAPQADLFERKGG